MKKLILFCSLIMFAFMAHSNAAPYDDENPPQELEYRLQQALFYYDFSSRCKYIFQLQNRLFGISNFYNEQESIGPNTAITSLESVTMQYFEDWHARNLILQELLIHDFDFTPDAVLQHKNNTYMNTNLEFIGNFLVMHSGDYASGLSYFTTVCSDQELFIDEFINFYESDESREAPAQEPYGGPVEQF